LINIAFRLVPKLLLGNALDPKLPLRIHPVLADTNHPEFFGGTGVSPMHRKLKP